MAKRPTTEAIPDLSVIVPAHKSCSFLEERLRFLVAFLDSYGRSYEVIVVDDGSEDGSREILKRLVLPHTTSLIRPHNGGKFAAIKDGMALARGKCRLFTDADIPYELSAIPHMVTMVCDEEKHLVIGDRTLSDSHYASSLNPLRRMTTVAFSACVRLLVGKGLHDTQCGLKAFRGDVADALFPLLHEKRFAGDVEVLAIARLHGLGTYRIPVTLRFQGSSTVRPIADGLAMLKSLAAIRLRKKQGAYESPELSRC
jgi:dolichyl-phosphate beta-glucosyltransferase